MAQEKRKTGPRTSVVCVGGRLRLDNSPYKSKLGLKVRVLLPEAGAQQVSAIRKIDEVATTRMRSLSPSLLLSMTDSINKNSRKKLYVILFSIYFPLSVDFVLFLGKFQKKVER